MKDLTSSSDGVKTLYKSRLYLRDRYISSKVSHKVPSKSKITSFVLMVKLLIIFYGNHIYNKA